MWTLKAQGKERTEPTVDTIEAVPTSTHMSLVELQRRGILSYLISQNCDGLHKRSGYRTDADADADADAAAARARSAAASLLPPPDPHTDWHAMVCAVLLSRQYPSGPYL